MAMMVCDKCRRVSMTVQRSRLQVEGVIPKGKCGCIFLCGSCRDEIVESLQAA